MDLLYDDCLYQIFQYLSLKDQINIFLTSKEFTFLISNMWRTKYKKILELNLNAKMEIGSMELNAFISDLHLHVEKVVLECESSHHINILLNFSFINTNELHISVKGAELLQQEFVTTLHGIFPNLKILKPFGKFTGAGFTMWKQLEQLTLSFCFLFKFDYLDGILKELPLHTLIMKRFKVELPRHEENALQHCSLCVLELNSYELSYFTPQIKYMLNLKQLHISDLYSSENLDVLHNKLAELHETHCIEGISTRDISVIFPKVMDLCLHTHIRHLILANDPQAFTEILQYICLIPTLRVLHFHACYVRREAEFEHLFLVSTHLDNIILEGCIICYNNKPSLDVEKIVNCRSKPLIFNFFGNKFNNDGEAKMQLRGHSDMFKLKCKPKSSKRCHFLGYEFR